MNKLEYFKSSALKAANLVREYSGGRALILHHNDTDGLTSAAILFRTLQRLNVSYSAYCLEKPYPWALEKIFTDPFLDRETLLIFADFGSGMLPLISSLVEQQRLKVLVLDHHSISPVEDKSITLLNPLSLQIDGKQDCSSSTVCYLLAEALGDFNSDLLPLGLLGAFGDGQISAGQSSGVNHYLMTEAIKKNLVRIAADKHLECKSGSVFISADKLCQAIDALGSFGYLNGGPDVAIKGLIEGFDERYFIRSEEELLKFDLAYRKFLAGKHLKQEAGFNYFILDGPFNEMGVKTVGLVAQRLLLEQVAASDKYLFGFQSVPALIPGLGEFKIDQYKVSYRIGEILFKQIARGESASAIALIEGLKIEFGLFTDAMHPHAGAFTLKKGALEAFLKRLAEHIESAR